MESIMKKAIDTFDTLDFEIWWSSYFSLVQLSHPIGTIEFNSFDKTSAKYTVDLMKKILEIDCNSSC